MTYKIQIGDEVREATTEEVAVLEAQHVEHEKIEAAAQAKIVARQAVLAKLGLTADEAAALLG